MRPCAAGFSAQNAGLNRGTVLRSGGRVVRVYYQRAGSLDEPPPPPREVLRELVHIGDDTYKRANVLHSCFLETLQDTSITLRPVLATLASVGCSSSRDLQLILIRYPRIFGMTQQDIDSVLDFLRTDVGLSKEQVRSVITKFPQVFSFSVKGHLMPQLAYLQSLGVTRESLAEYIAARPLILGEGIETVIKFLKICGVQRRQVAALLRSYPIDYCCRFIFPSLSELSPIKTWKPNDD